MYSSRARARTRVLYGDRVPRGRSANFDCRDEVSGSAEIVKPQQTRTIFEAVSVKTLLLVYYRHN